MADVTIRFFQPHRNLSPYVTTYYLTEVEADADQRVTDYLHPEWANLRFISGVLPMASVGLVPPQQVASFSVAGPTSRAFRFTVGKMRAWGIGLLPLGWARLIGVPAEIYADRFVDGSTGPAFKSFENLASKLNCGLSDVDQEVALLDEHLMSLLQISTDSDDHQRINRAQQALSDPNVSTVSQFSERVGQSPRSVERLSRRVFGFPPKLLLRRQRFLRSLSQFMLDPTMRWISTLDSQYFDQAHFARDFNRFMGMSARQYGNMDHPILSAAAFARMAAMGAAMQALHVNPVSDIR